MGFRSFFRIQFLSLLLIIISFQTTAQIRFERNKSSVDIFHKEGTTRIQLFEGEVIRILHSPSRNLKRDTSLVITKLPVEQKDFIFRENADNVLIRTNKHSIQVNSNGAVSISDTLNKIIFSEDKNSPVLFSLFDLKDEETYHAKLNFNLSPDEAVYGLGQFQNGIMNYRGHELTLIQENTQVAVPFMLSSKKYALMPDNYSKIIFHDVNDSTWLWFEAADIIDYYFMSGTTMDDVIKSYRNLTGSAPMLGKWAYGYWQSKERYKTQDEVLKVAREFRDRKIPVDNIVQDWMYWGEDWAYWNAMKFDTTAYPDPAKMVNELHDYNFHIMFSIWPVPGQNTELYKQLAERKLLYEPFHWTDGHTYDAYHPEARILYWQAVNKGLFSIGADAFWMDASEPEVFLAPNERSTRSIGRTSLGSIYHYFNTYSLVHTQGLYEGQRSVTSDKRVCIVTRSAFLGQQRYAATTWSGDIVADWDVYKNQIPAGLNFCMSGLPYWSNDIGGFHVRRYGGFPEGAKDSGYRELYVRWFQYGTFNPIFRSHGTDTPREPWQFGEPGSWAYDAILKYVNLRYRLMPYIYSLAWQVTNNGYTMMRGLTMDFPNEERVYNINDQYMFGPSILVNPVTEHMYYGESYKNEVIPSERLRTVEGKNGVYNAQYFNGVNFDTLVVDSSQTELLFDMFLGKDMPPIVNWERNSIRWSGSFKSRAAGEYEFWLTTDDAIRFYIEDKKLVDQWNNKGTDTTYRIKVKLNEETWYSFKVEYARMANASKFRLGWRTPEMISKKFNPSKESGTRSVYLPPIPGGWYDFWTGENLSGGNTIEREVPIDIMPLYVKAGSIIPMGPLVQYADEKKDPIELRIYTGADAKFELYDDSGDGYNYEKGEYSLIPIAWNESTQTLVIGDRSGSYPGMPEKIQYNIIWAGKNKGTGVNRGTKPDASVTYTGKEISIKK